MAATVMAGNANFAANGATKITENVQTRTAIRGIFRAEA